MSDRKQETYDRLLLMVGEVHSDTKHILASQASREARVSGIEDRVTVLERMRWKIIGAIGVVPAVIATLTLYIDGSG